MNTRLSIDGGVGFRKDGGLDVEMNLDTQPIVWNVKINPDGFDISLTDGETVAGKSKSDYEILETISTSDSIELRVWAAEQVRDYFPAIREEYIDAFKELIHEQWNGWGCDEPETIITILEIHRMMSNLGINL